MATRWTLFFTAGAPLPSKSFRVIIRDGETVLANRRVDAQDSGLAADAVLDTLAHPDETRLEINVTG